MLKVRYLEDFESEYWNKFVDMSEQGSCFSKTWWLDIATQNDYKICIYEGEGEIFAGLPLPYFSTRKINIPRLTQSVGILFVDKKNIRLQKKLTNQKEQTNSILEFIHNNVKSFNMNFHYNYDYWLPFYWKHYRQTTLYTYIIEYKDFVPEKHFSGLSKGHKWILNKVKKKTDLYVSELKDLNTYYEMSKKTFERQNLKIGYSFELLNQFHEKLQENNAGKMFQVLDEEGNIHAVNYVIYDEHEAYYWLGASDSTYRNFGGHTFLIWDTIQYFSDKTKRFNFGGSMMEDVEKNFKNFGGMLKPYFNIYTRDHILSKELRKIIPKSIKSNINHFLSKIK